MAWVEISPRVPPVRGPGASQEFNEHPWGAKAHTPAKLLRPRTVGNLFGENGGAHGHDLMGEAAMQAFAMGRQPPFAGGSRAFRRVFRLGLPERQRLVLHERVRVHVHPHQLDRLMGGALSLRSDPGSGARLAAYARLGLAFCSRSPQV